MRRRLLLIAGFVLAAAPLRAQLVSLPALPELPVPELPVNVGGALDSLSETARLNALDLLRLREVRIGRLLRQQRATIEPDRFGQPARRGELLLLDAAPAQLEAVRAAGFAVLEIVEIAGLKLTVTRLTVPHGMSLA